MSGSSRFMGSPDAKFGAHWDHEPLPSKQLAIGNRQSAIGRFMGRRSVLIQWWWALALPRHDSIPQPAGGAGDYFAITTSTISSLSWSLSSSSSTGWAGVSTRSLGAWSVTCSSALWNFTLTILLTP